MGNFEKLSVLVIGVIIVMILVVAIYTWTGNPDETDAPETALVPTAGGALPSDALASSVKETGDGWSFYDQEPVKPTDVDDVLVVKLEDLDPKTTAKEPLGAKVEETVEKAAEAVTAEEQTYEIQSNDTLGLISQKFYGTTKYWPKIAQRNDLVPERLRVGKKIFIPVLADAQLPKSSGASSEPASSRLSGAKPGSRYKVRGGETIQEIAKAAYGSIERWPYIYVNNLEVLRDPENLPAGTELRLPE